ncbi:MAG TPA: hypothetical protein VER32_05935 [Pyrinomonadaceae bacterium]|nr:hypothetical protein [Pyrinomonadaceae bacterium]
MTSSFTTRTAGLSDLPPDPSKHVNFTFGMVLGVDDLKQEFAYLAGRDQWLARDLLGYGTAAGLGVSTDYDNQPQGTVEVVVGPGTAVSPQGQLIRVGSTQCADLNGWLARAENRARADSVIGNANSGTLPLYVVLSYRACATDAVPIPGEPCRSEEESMAASRLADNYRLELSFDAPDQREENALREFVRWLEKVNITGQPGGDGFTSLANFERAVREAMQGGAPPASMRVDVADACQYLRAAFRIWTTELRPSWLGAGATPGVAPTEEGVLLAELSVPVVRESGEWVVAARASREVEVSEGRRPYLLHLRMIQEWIECGRRVRYPGDTVMTEYAFGLLASPGTSEAYSRADHTHGTPPLVGDVEMEGTRNIIGSLRRVPLEYDRETAQDGQVLTFFIEDGEEDEQAKLDVVDFGGERRDRKLRDDTGGRRWRPADIRLQGRRVAPARDAGRPEPGQVLTYVAGESEEGFWQAMTVEGATSQTALSGDVTGPTEKTVVQGLQGTPVVKFSDAEFAPKPGQVLTYVGSGESKEEAPMWVAADPPAAAPVSLGGDVIGLAANTRVTRILGASIAGRSQNAPFANGDVLIFNNGNWVPQPPPASAPPPPPPPPALAGDVVGPANGNTLGSIKGFGIRSRQPGPGVPSYNEGDVLTFRSGLWVPETPQGGGAAGTFVERPAGLPAYAIVAAGIVSHESARGPVYNNLSLRVVGNGLVTVGFDGYRLPDETFQYVVKALPVFNAELRAGGISVMFDSFLSTDNLGFRLRVLDNGVPMDGEQLRFVELMIEVSRYERLAKE